MAKTNATHMRQIRRTARTRAKVRNTAYPRLSVHRTNHHIYAQIIDDTKHITLVAASDVVDKKKDQTKVLSAKQVGEQIASKAKEKKITKVVFDRGSFRYHGRIKALADAAREAGLQF